MKHKHPNGLQGSQTEKQEQSGVTETGDTVREPVWRKGSGFGHASFEMLDILTGRSEPLTEKLEGQEGSRLPIKL